MNAEKTQEALERYMHMATCLQEVGSSSTYVWLSDEDLSETSEASVSVVFGKMADGGTAILGGHTSYLVSSDPEDQGVMNYDNYRFEFVDSGFKPISYESFSKQQSLGYSLEEVEANSPPQEAEDMARKLTASFQSLMNAVNEKGISGPYRIVSGAEIMKATRDMFGGSSGPSMSS